MFPVQQVAILVASWEATKSFFFFFPFFLCTEMLGKMLGEKKKKLGNVKKMVLISSPGQWTGNHIIFKGGLK